ncbi:MAG: P1 family peptidase, partial [Acidobacteria bacterium]|nr:P1 family peptidase [Acidobacteriota bacterium]
MALFMFLCCFPCFGEEGDRPRLRDLGVAPGILQPGALNAITDVAGVRVGHQTLVKGESIRTGVTAILPHEGNVFQSKVPAGVWPANAFGKA